MVRPEPSWAIDSMSGSRTGANPATPPVVSSYRTDLPQHFSLGPLYLSRIVSFWEQLTCHKCVSGYVTKESRNSLRNKGLTINCAVCIETDVYNRTLRSVILYTELQAGSLEIRGAFISLQLLSACLQRFKTMMNNERRLVRWFLFLLSGSLRVAQYSKPGYSSNRKFLYHWYKIYL